MRFSAGVVASAGYIFQNAEASSLVSRFTVTPSDGRKSLIDTLVGSLKTAGVWSKLDLLYVMAAADAQAAKLNWVSTSFNLTAINSPSFAADRGFSGDGLMSYLDTGFNPTTAPSPKLTQDDATQGFWSLTNTTNAGGQSFEFGRGNTYLNRQISGPIGGRTNTNAGIGTIITGPLPGLVGWSRAASNAWAGYKNGNGTNSGTDTSTALYNGTFLVCSVSGTQFGVNQNAIAFAGSSFSAQNWADAYAAFQVYLSAAGAI